LKLVKLLLEAKDNTQHLNKLKGRYMALAAAHYLGWDEDHDTNDKEADITHENGHTGEVKWHGAEDALPKGIHYYSHSDSKHFDALPKDMAPGEELHDYNDDITHAKKSNDGKRITIVLKDENRMIMKMLEARTVHLIGNPTSVHVVVPNPEHHGHFRKRGLFPTIDPSTITRGGKTARRSRSDPSAGGTTISRRISLNATDREAVPETVDQAKANAANMHKKGSFNHALATITEIENERIEQLMGSKATVEEAKKRKKALDELTKIHHEHSRAHERRSKKSNK